MKRQFPGLHVESRSGDGLLEGVFLSRVDRTLYRWHPQKPFFSLRFSILEPKLHSTQTISGRLYCTSKALWKLNWFLRDFTTMICSPETKSTRGLYWARPES